MKMILAGLFAAALITIGADLVLDTIGFSAAERTSTSSVRLDAREVEGRDPGGARTE